MPCELDVFVSKLTPDGRDLELSTYLGGEVGDTNAGLALADDGTAYVTGTTRSPDCPVVGGVQSPPTGSA
jgi:hypothetical protein